GEKNGLVANLPAGVPVQGFAFADEVNPLAAEALASDALTSGSRIRLDPSGSRSDLAGALRDALRRSIGARSPQAVVLFSDGRQVGGDGEGLLSELSAAGVAVFAVAAAAELRRDVSIVHVDAPATARMGQTIVVRVELRGWGEGGQSVEVRLDSDNVRQLERVTLDEPPGEVFGGAPLAATAEFEVYLPKSGPQRLVATVLPTPGETSDENNRFQTWVKVGVDPAKVLVIAGATAGRQYASLHAALSRTPWVALRELDEPQHYAALTSRSILEQDVIVLMDLAPRELTRAQWSALDQAVRDRGASVILCAGQRLPDDYAEHATAAVLLPFDAAMRPTWRTWPGGEPHFRVAPPSGSELAETTDHEFWRQLPPLSRMLPLKQLRGDARPLLVERDGGAAIMTEASLGIGRVYFIATDQSWRWRGPRGGEGGATAEREQFWPQLVRLAAGEPFTAAQGDMRLDADDVAPEPQSSVAVRARVHDPYGNPLDSPTQTLHVLRYGTRVREITLNSRRQGSGQYEGSIDGLTAGDYVVRLEPPEDPTQEIPPDAVELPLHVAPSFEAEMANLSGDEPFLRRIAESSGGQFFTLDQLQSLPRRLEENRQKLKPLVEYPLWDSPYLFAFVLACLSAEWALRKKFGLA
ncbi:MAG: hypothetical protein ABIP55_06305, partial [Tepidisphaeraceae bacterium]